MMRATFLLTAVLALGAVAGCGGDSKKSSTSGTPAATSSTSSAGGEQYPAAVEATFMRECTRTSGGKSAICQCAFDKIKATISYEDFKREDTAIAAGATPSRRFTNAIADCR